MTQRLKNDINFKIMNRLRTTVRNALNRNPKKSRTIKYIMCSIPEFKLYIEKLWLPGMNWNNWGSGPNKWNLDHIIPCFFFKDYISDEVEKYMCCKYQNLQPLWWEDNMAKGKIIR